MKLLSTILVFFLHIPLAVCQDTFNLADFERTDIDTTGLEVGVKPQEAWKQLKLSDYVYTLEQRCYCPWPQSAQVYIRNEAVVAIEDLGTGDILQDPTALANYYTIPQYFELIKKIFDQQPYLFSVRHHKLFGYPEIIEADIEYVTADDELYYRIKAVEALVKKPQPR